MSNRTDELLQNAANALYYGANPFTVHFMEDNKVKKTEYFALMDNAEAALRHWTTMRPEKRAGIIKAMREEMDNAEA